MVEGYSSINEKNVNRKKRKMRIKKRDHRWPLFSIK